MNAQEQRKLLELAAKAANVDFYTPEGMDTPWCGRGFYLRGCVVWNPLTDDGDALRLAVQLFRDIRFWYFENSVSVGNELRVACGDDPCAATRRAIVYAAALVGKQQEAKP